MKYLLFSFLALLPFSANAQFTANAIRVTQRLPDNSAFISRDLLPPASSADGIFRLNGSTALPEFLTLGTGFAISSGVIRVTDAESVAWANVTGKPSFSIIATTGVYSDLTGIPSTFIPSSHTHPASQISDSTTTGRAVMTAVDAAAARTTIGAGIGNGTVTSVIAGTGLSGGTITSTGTISLPNIGTTGTYSGITTDAQGRVTAGTSVSQSSASRALNSTFQISSSRPAMVFYSVRITTTVSIGSNQDGDVILEIASDSGFTSNVQTLSVGENGQTVTLAIALNSIQSQTMVVSGFVPTGYYARLRTVNNTGTPTYLYRNGQEVLM